MAKKDDTTDASKDDKKSKKGKPKKPKIKGASGSVLGPFITVMGALLFIAAMIGDTIGDNVLHRWTDASTLLAWSVAAQLHLAHAIALVAIGIYVELNGRSMLVAIGSFFLVVGLVLFSGSLYAAPFIEHEHLGLLTLSGGVVLLAAWLLLALHVLSSWRVRVITMTAPQASD